MGALYGADSHGATQESGVDPFLVRGETAGGAGNASPAGETVGLNNPLTSGGTAGPKSGTGIIGETAPVPHVSGGSAGAK